MLRLSYTAITAVRIITFNGNISSNTQHFTPLISSNRSMMACTSHPLSSQLIFKLIFSSVRASDAGRYECQVSMSKKLSMFVELTVLGNIVPHTFISSLLSMFQWLDWRWWAPGRSSPRAGPWCSWCVACSTWRGRGRSSGNRLQIYNNLYPP